MGRLETLAILMTLGAWTPAAFVEPPAADMAKPAPAPSHREEPPAPPRQYLETGANLFNKGRYELAAKYFRAAGMYRDRLSESERIVLDVYAEKLEEYRRETLAARSKAEAGPAAVDGGVVRSSAAVDAVGAGDLTRNPDGPTTLNLDAAPVPTPSPGADPTKKASAVASPRVGVERGPVYGSSTWRDSATPKEKARWLMKYAREQIHKNHLDLAERAIAEARTMKVEWTLFDETPDKMAEALEKAKTKRELELASSPDLPHDRKTAKARLKEARNALAASDFDRAEAIARDVKSWNLGYGLFDDTPDKVAGAVNVTRRRRLGQTGNAAAPAPANASDLIFHATPNAPAAAPR